MEILIAIGVQSLNWKLPQQIAVVFLTKSVHREEIMELRLKQITVSCLLSSETVQVLLFLYLESVSF